MQMRLWKNCTWSMLQFSSVAQSCPTLCDPMDARRPCPSPTPRVCPNSCPLNLWCHPIISFSVIPFSFHLQSFPASGSFPVNQLFTSGGQSIGVSASTSVLLMNIWNWSPLGWSPLESHKGDLCLMFMKWVLKLYSMYIKEKKMIDGPKEGVNF